MRRRALLLIVSCLCILAVAGCRSRRATEPQTTPPPVESTAPQPSQGIPSTDDDFVTPAPEPDVLSGDIVEANRVARDRGWIRDAFFQYDASTLYSAAQEALRATASWLRDNPQFRIRVEGHCDERGTEQYNLSLGDRRAETAAAYLATLGVDRSRIETISYGEERPFEVGSSESAWAQNRRAHLVLSGRM